MLVAYRASGVRKSRRRNAGDPDADIYVVQDYIAGTVEIDVFRRGERDPIWRGIGEVDVYQEENAAREAGAAVAAILAEFPARPEELPPDSPAESLIEPETP